MKNTFRKGLVLLMILCLLVLLFGLSVFGADMSADDQFTDVNESSISDGMKRISNDTFSALQWNLKAIGMEEAWRSGLTGKGVVVAIVDSGLSGSTMDIDQSRILPGKNCVGGTGVDDTLGHGTFVAGIIGATKDNGVGIAGIAPGATIIPIKTSDDGSTQDGVSAQAIYAAVDEFHCDVINYSSGAKQLSSGIREAVSYAVSKGVIIVCSTGNDGSTTLYYPGALEDTIGVGSINKGMERSDFSHRNKSIFVVAPGEDVYSLGQGGSVRSSSGTSFSAPFVTGLAALLKEAHPEMNTADFKQILMRSSKDLGEAGYDVEYGYGLIQVPAAIRAAAEYFGTAAPDMPEIPEPTPEPGYNQTIWEQLFNFSWLRDLFQNIIRNLFKGWNPNFSL